MRTDEADEYPPCTGRCCQGLAVASERLEAAQRMLYEQRDEIQRLNGLLGSTPGRLTQALELLRRFDSGCMVSDEPLPCGTCRPCLVRTFLTSTRSGEPGGDS